MKIVFYLKMKMKITKNIIISLKLFIIKEILRSTRLELDPFCKLRVRNQR